MTADTFPPPPPPEEPLSTPLEWAPPAWPPVPPRLRHHVRNALVLLALFASSLTAGGLVGAKLVSSTPTASTSPSTSNSQPSVAAPGGNAGNPNGSGNTGGSTSQSSIAARVDQAVVDITATLAGRSGIVAGTGMVISPSGLVLTNNHVIEGSATISVQIDGTGPAYSATVVGDDPTADIALLQIKGVSGLATVPLGDSSSVAVGDPVLALGNALGQGGTPAEASGTVTAVNQTITAGDETGSSETLQGLLQIDANIQPGDSGGPLVNAAGQVIGIDTAAQVSGRFGPQQTATTEAYAIPINAAMAIVHQIESGVATSTVHIGQGALLGVEVATGASASGAAVVGVQAGSPAASAGVAAGDVIVGLSGQSIGSSAGLRSAMQAHNPGDHVTLTWVDASGTQHSATVQLAVGPPA